MTTEQLQAYYNDVLGQAYPASNAHKALMDIQAFWLRWQLEVENKVRHNPAGRRSWRSR